MSRDEPMDWETMEAIEPQAGEMLERAMSRYARLRLDPSAADVRRARMAVMETAWRARIEADKAGRRWPTLPFSRWNLRRVSLAASAAVFAGLLLGSSVFAASRAGGPLYDTRIAVEEALLPSDPSARLEAQIANAQVRLAEAYDAQARNDQGALTAALRAYGIDAAALAETTGPGAARALAAIEQHRDVLLALIEHADANALDGLNQALASSDKAIERLSSGEVPGAGNGNGDPNGSGGNGNPAGGGNSGGGTSGGGGHPGATPGPPNHPSATPKPDHTPKPAATPKPDPTPKANHTPKPGPSGNPGGNGNGADPSPGPSGTHPGS